MATNEGRVEYLIEPIPEADPEVRTIPHFTVRARRGDYTGGPFLWVLDETEARIVVRAISRDDELRDRRIREAAAWVAATEASRRDG